MTERLTILIEEKGSRVVKRNIRELGDESRRAGDNVDFLTTALAGIAATAAVATLTAAARASIELADALAEVSTLLTGNDVAGEVERLGNEANRLAVEFGSLPVEQARAFYQVISAGASDAAEATEILTVANQLAVGGVTDVFTAADGLTTVLNAYGDQVQSAAQVSDVFFVGVRQGKTTVEELSSTIGRIAPLAAQTGVSLEELVSGIAALTKGGISTAESVTGLRAVLAAVSRPSADATALAEELGIEFNATALEAQGLAGFLDTVSQAAGGNTEQLARLFGGVEALVPILALTGTGAADFAETLEQAENAAGATEEAFERLANSPGFQLNRLAAAIKVELIELGNIVLPLVTASARFLADNLSLIVAAAQGAAAALALLAAPRIIQGIQAATGAVRLLTAALAANPFVALAIAIGVVIGLLIEFADTIRFGETGLATLGDVAAVTWDRITSGIQAVVDFFAPAFNSILSIAESVFGEINISVRSVLEFAVTVVDRYVAVWAAGWAAIIQGGAALPGAISNFAQGAANALISAFEFAVNKALNGLNRIIRGVNAVLDFVGADFAAEQLGLGTGQLTEFSEFTLGRFEGSFSEGGQALGDALTNGLQTGWNQTVIADTILGGLDNIVAEAEVRAQNRAADQRLIALANERSTDAAGGDTTTTTTTTPTSPSGGGGGAASARELNEELDRANQLLQVREQILTDLRGPTQELELRQTALRQLLAEGAISTQEFTEAMRDLNVEATALNNTISGGLQNGLARIAQQANNIGQQMSDFVVDAFNKATDAIVQFAKTGEFNVRQFFQDLFAQLLKLAANQLFSQLIGGLFPGAGALGGGGGGFLGGLLGFQNGGEFTVGGNNNSPDSQLVAFRATRGENVSITTPGQQRNGTGNGGGTTVVQSPPVNVVAQLGNADVVNAFDNAEGETVIINMLQRNANTVRQIAQG